MLLRVENLTTVRSTNELVKQAIEAGQPEGLVVRARRQSGGYGRQGRAWASPEGGLYCSWLLRPNVPLAQLPTLSLVVGLAVRDAAAALVSDSVAPAIRVKWPNDVVVAPDSAACEALPARAPFCKLCGISLEAHQGGVCVGIGVNVRRPRAAADVGGKNVPAYLEDLAPAWGRGPLEDALDATFSQIASVFSACYDRWLLEGFAPFSGRCNETSALAGCAVRIEDHGGGVLACGTACGIDEHGRLVVRRSDGTTVPVASGEAHVLLGA
ncbi:biotin--[acetyl-CoA-carboxylase] ligase [Xiamenia xianingshaonis]|uniref:biotin--[biotin carboxyl-carrier protein] ligase n=1 Tax=Xiamenia xianingshaonis TaxID=2682776 RepID=A0A9E6SU26_9ACTN|nr:biotin--[acetyl-CoA-carboxylase] ligase [Xiamenia xianingshaonis]NHM14870.1 biotin--[acetyl-CoA-carboxylase] ligase [Xiamenia xianingshaonis]QTU84036.1 biotin--[acetyl-CoA-carboxylase] ligase [Xiamenia xianingshaonis]